MSGNRDPRGPGADGVSARAEAALPDEARSDPDARRAPVCGSCAACGCPLGYAASERDGAWYCCGACAGSGRCSCGCEPDRKRRAGSDPYVPTRRMFASRRPDELLGEAGPRQRNRAFPFSDPNRGR